MLERTIAIITPDAVNARHHTAIERIITENGMTIIHREVLDLTPSDAVWASKERVGRGMLCIDHINFLCGGTSILLIIEGENCISRMTDLTGDWNPNQAENWTIRGKFGSKGPKFDGFKNAIRGPQDPVTVLQVMNFFREMYNLDLQPLSLAA